MRVIFWKKTVTDNDNEFGWIKQKYASRVLIKILNGGPKMRLKCGVCDRDNFMSLTILAICFLYNFLFDI